MELNLTIVVIAKNEEEMLPDFFKSVEEFAKIIVIDTGSSDKTINLAKKNKAEVYEYLTGKNFSDWRNFGLKKVDTEWILYLDADERLTSDLKKEILDIVQANFGATDNAYAIPRKNIILGKELTHGGWYPDYQKRFFRKAALKSWHGDLHEEPDFNGKLGHIKNPMIHVKHESFSQMMDKTNIWSEYEAKLMFEAHHPKMTVSRFFSAMFREFWYRMIKKMAFLDGREGTMFAIYQVISRFISYSKLWEMQKNKNN